MIRKKRNNIEWLEFEILAPHPELRHGVFLRHGGVSDSSFSSLNAIMASGDDPLKVSENRKRMCDCLGIQNLVNAKHIHDKEIKWVKETGPRHDGYDGLMTSTNGLGLMATHADCQAAIFFDPIEKAIATVHAGWKGQGKNIYKETIEQLKKAFNSKVENLLVGISPSLGPENSEFIHYKTELPQAFWDFQIQPTYFNLWEISRSQLLECGILPHHIEIASIDTYANSKDFFSYRREKASGKVTGGHGTIAALCF